MRSSRALLLIQVIVITAGLSTGLAAPTKGLPARPWTSPASKLYALTPAASGKAVGLFQALGSLSKAELGRLAGWVQQTAGLPLDQTRLQNTLQQGQKGLDGLVKMLMVHSPAAMSRGFETVYSVPALRERLPNPAPTLRLPAQVDLGASRSLAAAYPVPQDHFKQIVGNLYQGSHRNPAVSDAQIQTNMLFAEVFNRLGSNGTAAAGAKFAVTYGGRSYTSLRGLLGALTADGYEVTVRDTKRMADFLDLHWKTSQGGKDVYTTIAAPLQVETSIADASGHLAVVPAYHSELVIRIAPRTPRAGAIDTEVRFFQGVPQTGFFESGASEPRSWTGLRTVGTARSAQAIEQIVGAGFYSDVVNQVAKQKNLPMGNYGGAPGVCNDSVARCALAAGGLATGYPLLGNPKDAAVRAALLERVKGATDRQDKRTYRRLLGAVGTLTPDTAGDPSLSRKHQPSQAQRAGFFSMPFARPAEVSLGGLQEALQIIGGSR